MGAIVFFAARPYFETALLEETKRRAELFQTTLDQALSRFDHLPLILKDDPQVVAALYGIGESGMNRRLAKIADQARVDAVYLMDRDGLTIAASNHGKEGSFLGQNYGFRHYFEEAMRGRHGTFFAIGATTRKPGYFIAEGLRNADDETIGVIAVKIDLAPLVDRWARTGELVFVSNADGVIFLASDNALRYRVLEPLHPFRRDEIAAERQFADEPLKAIDWSAEAQDRASLEGVVYQHVELAVGDRGWKLHYLSPLGTVTERAWLVAIGTVLLLAVITVLSLSLRSARMRAALESSQRDRRALAAANTELRRTQEELKRSSKLAALGQLAASVTHELGQPISALRNYLTAAELTDGDNRLIAPVGGVVTRMEGITRQLRFFASPSSDAYSSIDLAEVVAGATTLVRHDAEAARAELRVSVGAGLHVLGDRLRLEQVLVNLLRNAIAAVEGRDQRSVNVSSQTEGQMVVLTVTDTGPGLGGRTFAILSEPFHTTRASGAGMGLGLAISNEIVREHGGQMSAEERPEGGASFSVTLPLEKGTHG
ncbi:MAG: ATP-binding protein [Pseudomonadota bacterium]